MARPSGRRDTVYEQVLDHARREIEDASAKIEELRKTLSLLEARVEAAKSVYEAVAARLNLEDEGNLAEAAYPEPPPRLEDLDSEEASAFEASEEDLLADDDSPADVAAEGLTAPSRLEVAPQPAEEANGSGNDVSLDLIRRHLEERARRNTGELHVSAHRPAAGPGAAAVADDEGHHADAGGSRGDGGRTVGFPGLSEADRKLIEEHMRRRAEANRDR